MWIQQFYQIKFKTCISTQENKYKMEPCVSSPSVFTSSISLKIMAISLQIPQTFCLVRKLFERIDWGLNVIKVRFSTRMWICLRLTCQNATTYCVFFWFARLPVFSMWWSMYLVWACLCFLFLTKGSHSDISEYLFRIA